MTARAFLQTIQPADVLRAYAGRSGCMCGCRGRYWVTAASRAEAEVNAAAAVDDDDVSEAQVTRVLRLAQAALAEADEVIGSSAPLDVDVDADFRYICVERGRRVHAVYLTEAARTRLLAQVQMETADLTVGDSLAVEASS